MIAELGAFSLAAALAMVALQAVAAAGGRLRRSGVLAGLPADDPRTIAMRQRLEAMR